MTTRNKQESAAVGKIDLKTRQRMAANLRKLKFTHEFESDAAMAEVLGVSRDVVNRALKGERTLGLDVALLIHRKLGVSLDWLVDRDPEPDWFDPEFTGPPRKSKSGHR